MITWVVLPQRWLALLILSAATVACAQTKPLAAKPITDAECEEFGRQLEDHFDNKDSDFYMKSFDIDALLNRASSGQGLEGADLQNMMAGFKKGLETSLGSQMRRIGGFKFLRFKRVGREQRLLCRVTMAEGGMNYQELVVSRRPDGKPRITDMYIYLSGEMMSETIRRAIIPMVAEKERSLASRLFGEKPDLIAHFKEWTDVGKLSVEGRHKEALAAYAKLPPSLQKEKFVLVNRMRSASALGDDKDYLAALDLWQRTYPKDPSLDLISIDAFVLRKQYARAMECVDRLDTALGGDPYLDFQRGLLFELMGDSAKSDEALNRAIANEPTLAEAHFQLLSHRVEERNFAAAITVLNRMEKDMGLSRQRLGEIVESDQGYARLVSSGEYRNWRGLPATTSTAPRPTAGSTAGGKAKPEPGGLILQSIMYKESGASATINNKFLTVGKKIDGNTVLAIEKDSVTLETPTGEKKVLRMDDVFK